MNSDMTYQEIDIIKSNINAFLSKIQVISQEYEFSCKQSDMDFFSFIAKHIIYFKYILSDYFNKHCLKVLISDLYYLILAIVKQEVRYVYVNERSVIENYMRMIMNTSVQDNHVTDKVFQEMRQRSFRCCFSDSEYSLIKNEYATSCGYIHGGDILDDNLVYVLEECTNKNYTFVERNKYFIRLQKILQIFDRLLIAENAIYINGCFHRKKSVLTYLLGQKQVDLLFQILNNY